MADHTKTAEHRLLEAMESMWTELGDSAYPVTAEVTPEFKEQLDSCYFSTSRNAPLANVSRIETNFGTANLKVVDHPIPNGFTLVSAR